MVHKSIRKGLCLLLVSACFLTGCADEAGNQKNADNTATEAAGTPAPELTETPTPTEEPIEEFIELTDEEIAEVERQAETYWGGSRNSTSYMVAYYKYIGLEELEVPVLVSYGQEEAEERFGGEWEPIPGAIWTGDVECDTWSWLRGTLTIAEIEQEMLNVDPYENRVYIANDFSVESVYAKSDSADRWNPPLRPFTEYMRWHRYWGTVYVYEEDGVPVRIDSIHYLD